MKKYVKRLSLVLAVAMLLTMSMVGCGKKDNQKGAGGDNAAASTANQPKITLSMFMCTSGLDFPDGVNPQDNYWINIIKKYANVDLIMDVPAYSDFTTKFNLLLSSGNLPDIVHAIDRTEINKRANEGAFIDLKSYYDKSVNVKKYITTEMMAIAADPTSGKNFAIPMASDKAQQGYDVFARWDLVKKYNDNKWPTSVDEWVVLMNKIHKANPDWIVMSNRIQTGSGLGYGGVPIFAWYGAKPYASRYEYDTGKVVSTFTLPEYKAAVQVMKQLYNDGVLDPEFATSAKYSDNKDNKNVLLEYNSCDQYADYGVANGKTDPAKPQAKNFEWMAAPMLTKYPPELKNPVYAQPFKSNPISGHGIYISSKCKTPDRAWQVIEGFASDEMWNAIFWGREGTEYTVVNGKKVPNATARGDKNYKFSLQYALIPGFTDGQEVKHASAAALIGQDYCDQVNKNLDAVDTLAKKNGVDPNNTNFLVASDEASKKLPESKDFITKATVEAIMGKITMDQFDQRVKDFQTKYGFIWDDYTKYIKDHKDEIAKKGVNFSLIK